MQRLTSTQSLSRDAAGKAHSDVLDFAILPAQSGSSVAKDDSVVLWGPGMELQDTPSSILTQSLQGWREDTAQLSAARAAEELHNMYANLPPEALELTFQDMITGNNSAKREAGGKAAATENKSPMKRNVVKGEVVKNVEQVNDASKGKKIGLFTKISLLLTRKEVDSDPSRKTLTQADLDRLLKTRRRRPTASSREGLYSASITPIASNRVSPITSPMLSPTPSFHELMIAVDGRSFGEDIINSDSSLEKVDEGPPAYEGSDQQRVLPQVLKRTTIAKDADDCSSCSTINLFSRKTSCRVCGKAFCPGCTKLQAKEAIGGRGCNDNCGVELYAKDG